MRELLGLGLSLGFFDEPMPLSGDAGKVGVGDGNLLDELMITRKSVRLEIFDDAGPHRIHCRKNLGKDVHNLWRLVYNSLSGWAIIEKKLLMETKMKLSARNVLKGKITKVIMGATTAHVLIDVNGTTITASITNEAAEELKLKEGQNASAIIKASDVMVAVD